MTESIASDIQLLVDGVRWGGWTAAEVTRTMEAMSGGFRLDLTERWPGSDSARPITAGARCALDLAGQTVVTGWVDDLEIGDGAHEHSLTITGRDAAGDLVDCSVASQPGEWRSVPLPDLVAALVRPFGLRLRADIETGDPLAVFRVEEGETVWRAIERACRYRQVVCISDGTGGLVLTRAGNARADVDLVRGQNIRDARLRDSRADRFSSYTVKGQRASATSEDVALAAHGVETATDPDIGRYRPLVILADDQSDQAGLAQRAQWEASVRRGRGRTLTLTVQGWRQKAGGRLWQPNELVRVDWWRIRQEMLITTIRHSFGAGGSTTDLQLQPPEAYAAEPLGRSQGAAW